MIVISASQSTTIDTLQKLLTRYNHNDTIHLDPNLFEYGHKYNVLIRKCNFLGACATANHQLHVLDLLYSGTPSVRIFGSNQRVMMRGDWLELKASAFVASCNGSAFYEIDNILFEWSVFERRGAALQHLSFVSSAKDPAIFRLPSYAPVSYTHLRAHETS